MSARGIPAPFCKGCGGRWRFSGGYAHTTTCPDRIGRDGLTVRNAGLRRMHERDRQASIDIALPPSAFRVTTTPLGFDEPHAACKVAPESACFRCAPLVHKPGCACEPCEYANAWADRDDDMEPA
jgi:hypothetical protein